ncbi:hypothetical protein Vretifemale_1455, partial [Volvox reticuliferus]
MRWYTMTAGAQTLHMEARRSGFPDIVRIASSGTGNHAIQVVDDAGLPVRRQQQVTNRHHLRVPPVDRAATAGATVPCRSRIVAADTSKEPQPAAAIAAAFSCNRPS